MPFRLTDRPSPRGGIIGVKGRRVIRGDARMGERVKGRKGGSD